MNDIIEICQIFSKAFCCLNSRFAFGGNLENTFNQKKYWIIFFRNKTRYSIGKAVYKKSLIYHANIWVKYSGYLKVDYGKAELKSSIDMSLSYAKLQTCEFSLNVQSAKLIWI